MARKKLLLVTAILGVFFLGFSTASAEVLETVFSEDWENGLEDWIVDNGVWQAGMPTSGPGAAYGGDQCAATVLAGNYFPDTDSRLFYSPIFLPAVSGREEIRLRFWHWFSFSAGDAGYVQISVFEAGPGWSAWTDISGPVVNRSGGWSRIDIDLTEYAEQAVRIAFYHTADSSGSSLSSGWYIDDISVIKLIPEFMGDFEGAFNGDIEGGWGDWSAEYGVWQVGTPISGPGDCNGGSQCVGTVLNGNYPLATDSRFISAPIQLPEISGFEEIRLRFWHWFSFSAGETGYVQISVYDVSTGWSEWDTIPNGAYSGVSTVWTNPTLFLTAYAGQLAKFAFYHTADSSGSSLSSGWYIDDIRVTGAVFPRPCEGDFDNDGDVDGSDLSKFAVAFGRTNCGSAPPCDGDFNLDNDVDGSDLAIFAADFGKTDCFDRDPFE